MNGWIIHLRRAKFDLEAVDNHAAISDWMRAINVEFDVQLFLRRNDHKGSCGDLAELETFARGRWLGRSLSWKNATQNRRRMLQKPFWPVGVPEDHWHAEKAWIPGTTIKPEGSKAKAVSEGHDSDPAKIHVRRT